MSSKFAESFVQLISAQKADEAAVLTRGYYGFLGDCTCIDLSWEEERLPLFLGSQKATKGCP